ncbi:MarR family transcriptional regulator [Dyella halodurans]|uniref:MarR family winged helix-turn-helix transcriptional regulator n=1 Tax=Dyella halodurans TaxID=1920171 RepID=A0ABV9BZZ4_9GAMM|nr:MarR family transcriptional regulator [Dyella halodurans]
MTDATSSFGPAAIGARLRRLSEVIDEDAGKIYAELGIDFQQRWVGILEQLALHGSLSVGELAAALGIRHASVSQTRRSLEESGLVSSEVDPVDARSRRLRLSPLGKNLVRRLEPLWEALNTISTELNAEAGNVVEALDRLDLALQKASLYERMRQKLSSEPSVGASKKSAGPQGPKRPRPVV